MQHTKTCKTQTLLAGTSCDLQYCPDCKIIHLAMGPIILQLSEVHFEDLANDLRKGLINLKSTEKSSPSMFNDTVVTLHS
jgi:hypothetical protein